MRAFWPVGEAAQADYELLRVGALAGVVPASPSSARFLRGGLVALISAPLAEPVFSAVVSSVGRPSWSPHADPREESLALAYQLLLDSALPGVAIEEARR